MRLPALNILLLPPILLGFGVPSPGQSIAVFVPPNARAAYPASINDRGDITGRFYDSTQGQKERGFLRSHSGTMEVFDVPNASRTSPCCIDRHGTVGGTFSDDQGVPGGFLRDDAGALTLISLPKNAASMQINAMNGLGSVTGTLVDASRPGTVSGFVRDSAGKFTVFAGPSGTSVIFPRGINDHGEVTGYYQNGARTSGFVRDPAGHIVSFDPPGSEYTDPFSINNSGDITGVFTDAAVEPGSRSGGKLRGFVRDHNGGITVFDVPSAGSTIPRSINNDGDITGWCVQGGGERGFVRLPGGAIDVFDAGARTEAVAINLTGDVTGSSAAGGFLRHARVRPPHTGRQ